MTDKAQFRGDPLSEAQAPTAVERWLKRRLGKRIWFILTAVFALCLFGGIALLIAGQALPGLIGVVLAALLAVLTLGAIVLGMVWAIAGALWGLIRGGEPTPEPKLSVLPSDLAALVRKLDQTRQDLVERYRRPTWIGLLVGVVVAAVYSWGLFDMPNPAYWSIPIAFVICPVIGAALAGAPAQAAFRARFKAELLPALMRRHGDLAPVAAGVQPDFSAAQKAGVLWRHHRLTVDDGFIGSYRGYPLEIYDLRLWRGDAIFKENTKKGTVALRVAVRIQLERALRATTAVTDQSSLLEDATSQDQRLQPLQLEDPLFEKVYAVRSTDEVGARGLLTPAVMQRLLAFSDGTGFSPPALLAEGKDVLFVLQYQDGTDLFEPLGLQQGIADHVVALEGQLATIFAMVDTAIEMAEAVVGTRSPGPR